MKYSKQRELILQALHDTTVHPTAEQLYAMIRVTEPTISLATVYRNLNLLAENGIIKKFSDKNGIFHFDHCTHNHFHFICSKCNRVHDISYTFTPDPAAAISAQTGLEVESYDILFHGICSNCKTN